MILQKLGYVSELVLEDIKGRLQEKELTEERPLSGKGEEVNSHNLNTSDKSINGAKLRTIL